jgi:RimJ/RimL family protein N-acetyltransferase
MVLALDCNLVVGQCAGVIHRHPDKVTELYVDEVGTATSHLRQGIATVMLAELFAWGRELGCREAWLGTELDNVAAQGLYRSFGGKAATMTYFEFDLHEEPGREELRGCSGPCSRFRGRCRSPEPRTELEAPTRCELSAVLIGPMGQRP